MSKDVIRFFAFLTATAGLGLGVALLGSSLIGSAGGPEALIITRLKLLEIRGVEQALASATLLGPKVQFQRMSVVLDADAQGATVTSTLDFTGELRRSGLPATRVSSLGLERARYRLTDGQWLPTESDLPRLGAIVEALERRRMQLEEVPFDGGIQVTDRRYRSLGWFIRSEREEVLVSEDYQFQGHTPERPIDDKGTRQLTLHEDEKGLFSFPAASR